MGKPILCRIGLHGGTWHYITDHSCVQEKKCPRAECGEVDTLIIHNYVGWVYENEESCDHVRVCERCGDVEKENQAIHRRTIHTWDEWGYYEEGHCGQVRYCVRCKGYETRWLHQPDHSMFSYIQDDSCSYSNPCLRCKEGIPAPNGQKYHKWGDWITHQSGERAVRVCRRCGSGETRQI